MGKALQATTEILGIGSDEAKRQVVAKFLIRLAQEDGSLDATTLRDKAVVALGGVAYRDMAAGAEPELKLCVTVDAYAGAYHAAPTTAVSRFNNAEAACATIAERWANVTPPPGAII
jgi:hypothetical protein